MVRKSFVVLGGASIASIIIASIVIFGLPTPNTAEDEFTFLFPLSIFTNPQIECKIKAFTEAVDKQGNRLRSNNSNFLVANPWLELDFTTTSSQIVADHVEVTARGKCIRDNFNPGQKIGVFFEPSFLDLQITVSHSALGTKGFTVIPIQTKSYDLIYDQEVDLGTFIVPLSQIDEAFPEQDDRVFSVKLLFKVAGNLNMSLDAGSGTKFAGWIIDIPRNSIVTTIFLDYDNVRESVTPINKANEVVHIETIKNSAGQRIDDGRIKLDTFDDTSPFTGQRTEIIGFLENWDASEGLPRLEMRYQDGTRLIAPSVMSNISCDIPICGDPGEDGLFRFIYTFQANSKNGQYEFKMTQTGRTGISDTFVFVKNSGGELPEPICTATESCGQPSPITPTSTISYDGKVRVHYKHIFKSFVNGVQLANEEVTGVTKPQSQLATLLTSADIFGQAETSSQELVDITLTPQIILSDEVLSQFTKPLTSNIKMVTSLQAGIQTIPIHNRTLTQPVGAIILCQAYDSNNKPVSLDASSRVRVECPPGGITSPIELGSNRIVAQQIQNALAGAGLVGDSKYTFKIMSKFDGSYSLLAKDGKIFNGEIKGVTYEHELTYEPFGGATPEPGCNTSDVFSPCYIPPEPEDCPPDTHPIDTPDGGFTCEEDVPEEDCPSPNTIENGVCTAPPELQCTDPKIIVNGVCVDPPVNKCFDFDGKERDCDQGNPGTTPEDEAKDTEIKVDPEEEATGQPGDTLGCEKGSGFVCAELLDQFKKEVTDAQKTFLDDINELVTTFSEGEGTIPASNTAFWVIAAGATIGIIALMIHRSQRIPYQIPYVPAGRG